MDVNQCKMEDSASESTSSPPSLAFLTSKSKPPTQEPIVLAADTGTTGHFVQKPQQCLSYDGPIFNVQQTAIPISVTLPDSGTMTNTHEATLRLPGASPSASKAYTFNNMASSLLSIGQLCDDGCVATFDKASVVIAKDNAVILQGKRDETPQRNCGWQILIARPPCRRSPAPKSSNMLPTPQLPRRRFRNV